MDELAAYERRLRRAGLPLLIEDYSAWEDIFTRAVPLIYLVVGVGLLSILPWTAARLVGPLAASIKVLTRAVPVLLIFMIVLFINTEMWQVLSDVSDGALLAVIALFIGVASAFVISRLPREVRELERDVAANPPLTTRQPSTSAS